MTELKLKADWRFPTTNEDPNGLEFISTLEHSRYPVYGLQFHPEMNIYEWGLDKHNPHSAEAVRVAQYFGNFFVSEGKETDIHANRKFQTELTGRYTRRPMGL
jgi:gamma-glutamyl hydrolase